MKKYLLTLTLLAMSTVAFAQNAPVDFETEGNGADWTWDVFEADTPPLEVIANPDPTGANTSATVAKIEVKTGGADYAGTVTDGIGTFTLNENNRIIKLMVWKSEISDVGVKLEAAGGWSEGEIKVANTKINEWEELTFDFSDKNNPPAEEGGEFAKVAIFPDFQTRAQDNIIYFDNLTFGEGSGGGGGGGGATAPSAPAATPTLPAEDVISLFSSAYSDVTVDTWRTDWSAASTTFTDSVVVGGVPHKQYSGLDFVGIETTSSPIDATDMTHFHMNVWSADYTSFSIKLVDFGADAAFGGDDDVEHQVDFASPAQGEWVTFDIPLADFTNLTTRASMAQYILVAQPTGAATIFVDNMYFAKSPSTSIDRVEDVPEGFVLSQNYPNPFNPSTNIAYTLPAASAITLDVFNIQGQKVATLVDGFKQAGAHVATFDASNLASGIYMYRLVSGETSIVKKMLLLK
jgi:hypothetical protein